MSFSNHIGWEFGWVFVLLPSPSLQHIATLDKTRLRSEDLGEVRICVVLHRWIITTLGHWGHKWFGSRTRVGHHPTPIPNGHMMGNYTNMWTSFSDMSTLFPRCFPCFPRVSYFFWCFPPSEETTKVCLPRKKGRDPTTDRVPRLPSVDPMNFLMFLNFCSLRNRVFFHQSGFSS